MQILKEVIHRVLKGTHLLFFSQIMIIIFSYTPWCPGPETHGDEHQLVLQQQLATLATAENHEAEASQPEFEY